MSRSYKKTPKGKSYWSSARHASDKEWKQSYNRKMRRGTSTLISSIHTDDLDEAEFPTVKSHSDVWDSKQDGPKRYFGDLNSDRIEYEPYYHTDYNLSSFVKITNENVAHVLNDFTFSERIINSIYECLNNYSYYYHYWTVYKLMWTYEDKIAEQKQSFKKMMRK